MTNFSSIKLDKKIIRKLIKGIKNTVILFFLIAISVNVLAKSQ